MKRASDVPPVVESSGVWPLTAVTASATRLLKSPGGVRKASPETEISMSMAFELPATSARTVSRYLDRLLPECWSLKRIFSLAVAVAGIRLVVGLPTSIVVISRLVGGK